MFSPTTWTRLNVKSAPCLLIRRFSWQVSQKLQERACGVRQLLHRHDRKCSCCHERIGDIRCRAMEKVLAGMARPCKFSRHGCEETVKFTELRSHEEEACPYAPYSCPFDGCAYRGALLYDHVRDEHALAPAPNCDTGGLLRGASVTLRRDEPAVHALLHGDRVSVILLLNGGDVLAGRSLSLVRICPHPKPGQEDEEVEYRMVVTRDEPEPGTGSPSLAASGKVQYVRRLEGYRPRHFLFVPDAFWGSSGSVVVTVTTTVTVHL
ncbi:uncharacterized protein [Triticum aestivum]|nr:uncharacterized protein LOC123126038 isoform X1 [Triticum aestivum]XP_045085251.1 uncharacterized protein LOC120965424 isoform X1 [Aegilops tauschii subsp. strangulata]